MYTIKQAAIRTGLAIPTIRAWERRYGVIDPARTASGYRLYDDEAIERLVAMRQLVEVDGVRPSQAADQVRGGGAAVAGLAARARQASVDCRPGRRGGSCRRRVGAVVHRGPPRRDPSDGHPRHRTAPRRGLRGGALRGGDEQRRLPSAARHRRGLGGGQHRRRHGARGQRDDPAAAGPVLRRGRRPLVAARPHRRDAAGLPARDRRDGVRGRRPARRSQRPVPRRERAGAQLGPDRRCGRRARRGRRRHRRSRRAGRDRRGHVTARVDEPARRLRRRPASPRPSPRRPVPSRSRPSWTRPSRSCASASARVARPDGRPEPGPPGGRRYPRTMETSSRVHPIGVSTWLWTSPLDRCRPRPARAAGQRLGVRHHRAADRAARRLGSGARCGPGRQRRASARRPAP